MVKSRQVLGRLLVIGMMALVAPAGAELIAIQPTPDRDGSASWVTQGVIANDILYVGNPGPGIPQYAAIMKFDISSVTGPVTAATLDMNAWVCNALGYYIKLEHFTVDNSFPIAYADSISTDVEPVGALQTLPEGIINQTVSWDITSALNADKAAGFTHSSFRVVLTDATGVFAGFISNPYNYVGFSSMDDTKGYFGPQISIVPEPVTLMLLMVGGMVGFIRKR